MNKSRNVEAIYPLTPMQAGMLYHGLSAPAVGMYFDQLHCVLQGELNVQIFQQAWQQVISRHAVLRSAFLWERAGEPLQVVYGHVLLPWQELDWRDLTAQEQEHQLRDFLHLERANGLDWHQPPLLRLTLIHLSDDCYRFIWSIHHILVDGWSHSILLKELFTCYRAYLQGETPVLPPIRPYRDYVMWQKQQDLSEAKQFWQKQLDGVLAPTPLVRDHNSTLQISDSLLCDEEEYLFTTKTTIALQTFSRQHQITLNTLVQGAWALLLSYYSGEQDVVFGVTNYGRPPAFAGVETMVGMFINTLPMRVKLNPQETLLPWLKTLHLQQSEMFPYDYCPLPQIQAWSSLPRGTALFDSILVFENYPAEATLLQQEDQIRIVQFQSVVEQRESPLVIGLAVLPGPTLRLHVAYRRDRFDAPTVKSIIDHYQSLLDMMITGSTSPLLYLSPLAKNEIEFLLHTYNNANAVADPLSERSLQSIFEGQVADTPDAIALVSNDEQLSYQVLNERTNQLAHYLQTLGVGPEVPVGLYMGRSLAMIIGLLGIWKAGGIYVPLDSDYPEIRLKHVMEEIQAPIVIVDQNTREQLPMQIGTFVLCLNTDWNFISQQPTKNPPRVISPDNLAYIIYTSGSTGSPNGVMVPHKAIFNHMSWIQSTFPLTSMDRVLQKTSMSFDVSVCEFFEALLAGGVLVLAVTGGERDAEYLTQLMLEQQITVVHFAPSVLQSLHENQKLKLCSSLRCIYCGGESLSEKQLQQFHSVLSATIHNLYGPTEACISVIAQPNISLVVDDGIVIGRPIAHSQAYILDRYMRPVPISVPGELYIGGEGLARGYLHSQELTAERFMPNPFNTAPGSRLYRTGDIARYLPGGRIQFLGRADRQVKIRGYRIEPGEIESVLSNIHGISECVVVSQEDPTGGRYLVAYIVYEKSHPTTLDEVRLSVQKSLPTHMVPAVFIIMDGLPITSSGKIDRQNLPAPEKRLSEGEDRSVHPLTPIEEMLISIWRQILNVDHVGIHDNFFDLGGHSLLATQIISRIREAFNLDLSVGTILAMPTIVRLAANVQMALQEEQKLILPPLVAQDRPEFIPLSFAQQRLWFLDRLAPGNPFYTMPIAAQLQEQLDYHLFEQSLAEIVRRHEVLRTSFVERDGYAVQVIAASSSIAVPLIDLQNLSPDYQQEVAQLLINQESSLSFELSRGPLLRVAILRLTNQKHVLLLNMHHIISDGWSMSIFIYELTTLYDTLKKSHPSPLPELPVQYADFALWQRQWLQGEALERQLAYWREQLQNLPLLQLPTDHPRPRVEQFHGSSLSFQFSLPLSQLVKEFSRQEGATLYMTLMATFLVLLWRYSGQNDLAVGMPVANRTHKDLEALIGFFVNTLVLRVQFSDDLSVRALVHRVRERMLEAHTYQDVPFEYLVEQLQPKRDAGHNPLIQVTLMLLNTPWTGPDISLASMPVENHTAKFDLSLSLMETANGLTGAWAYSTDLFEAETIQRMHTHWQRMLEAMVTEPTLSLNHLPLLTSEEERRILYRWNNTQIDFPQPHCLPLLIEQQVERTPDAVAVVFDDQIFTYQVLDQQANQWAHLLYQQGVGPETLVGVCMNRSLEMLIAVLAILKAGGAYVPLDPAMPQERLRLMVQDAHLSLMLTQNCWSMMVESLVPNVLYLDATPGSQRSEILAPPPRQLAPDNLAYVIYTSGSTGTPKGVMISQRGICNRLFWAQRTYQMTSQDSILQKSPLTFDISVEECFWPLLIGAHTVIARPEGHRDSEYMIRTIVEQQITILRLVTPMLTVLVETAGLEACRSLRLLICGGETLIQEVVQRFYERLPAGVVLHNFYGATEASVDSTFWVCGPEQHRGVVPIGKPMDNVAMYVLNESFQPVPIGVVGELYIGGISLARGYLEQPGLTAERFVPDPHSGTLGGRLYRTGDQGRSLPDGTLEFLGRTDTQVKIRGYRIELGEIEAVLSEHPGVQDAVVVVREDQPGDKRLAAYITSDPSWQVVDEDTPDAEPGDEYIENWREVFNETYYQTNTVSDQTLNLSGWNSSYTREPLSEQEMHAWLEQALKCIFALNPSRVLEIGCGTGLLLFRIAPQSRYYCGSDFSSAALEYVQKQLIEEGNRLAHVDLRHQYADDFTGLQSETFDTIILNSVVQYFPGIEYLLHVLENALKILAPGGAIFIGDVRHRSLLTAFHTAVVLKHASEALSCDQLKQQVMQRIAQEKELVIDPAFFVALQHAFPQISSVQIEPERGKYQNELTQFRYNVIIYVKGEKITQPPITSLDWLEERLTLSALHELLTQQKPASIGIKRVPNARVQRYVTAAMIVMKQEMPATVAGLRTLLNEQDAGIDPEQFWVLGSETSYTVKISWSSSYSDGSYDVLLQKTQMSEEQMLAFPSLSNITPRSWLSYANRPQSGKIARMFTAHVQQWLRGRLPEYMLPAFLMTLDRLPLTANGKVDRQALPASQDERPELKEAFVAPRTSVETTLAEIWVQVLGIKRIGIHDNFFALGGHSLLATQVISRINQAFNMELPLQIVFQKPVIIDLAEEIMQTTFALEDATSLERLLVDMEK